MSCILFLCATDIYPGRVDRSNIPHADLIALLTADIDPQDYEAKLTVDDSGNVTAIAFKESAEFDFASCSKKSVIEFRYVPPTTVSIEMCTHCTGAVETSDLPDVLQYFDIGANSFFGTFCTKSLPSELREANLMCNAFEGSLKLEHLPPKLTRFIACMNRFSGELYFGKLPAGLTLLELSSNNFTGKVDLRDIPASLEELSLCDNAFNTEMLIVNAKHIFRSLGVDCGFQGRVFLADGTRHTPPGTHFMLGDSDMDNG